MAIGETKSFCRERGVNMRKILSAGASSVSRCSTTRSRPSWRATSRRIDSSSGRPSGEAYRAILPDPTVGEFGSLRSLFSVLDERLRALAPPADTSGFMSGFEELLDRSVAEGYVIRERPRGDGEGIEKA